MSESNKALAKRWFEEVWNKGRREAIAEMLAPDAPVYDGDSVSTGPEGFYPFFDRLTAAFSDMRITPLEVIAEGDMVCVRWRCNVHHTGNGLGMPASNKRLEVTGIVIMRVANGKIAAGWQNWDMLGLLQQIKAEPAAATYIAASV
jgi:steroid delta-isomerase-like uncharacterized protein